MRRVTEFGTVGKGAAEQVEQAAVAVVGLDS